VAKHDPASPVTLPPPQTEPPARGLRRQARHARWAAYAWGAVILVSLIVATPLALGSIGRQLIAPPENQVFMIASGPPTGDGRETPADATYLNVAVVGLDEAKKVVTLRLSGNRACRDICPAFQVRFFSLSDRSAQRAGRDAGQLRASISSEITSVRIARRRGRRASSSSPRTNAWFVTGASYTVDGGLLAW